MTRKLPSAATAEPTFEIALQRLESIVGQMEGGQLPLEELIERFEEGSKLVKVCQQRLESAEKRIEIITRGPSGRPELAEFEPAAPAPPASTAKAAAIEDDEVSLF